MHPKISVVIPVYNQEKYLAETIESILAQTFRNFELILVDDGSKDKSAEIIQQYTQKDSRIMSILQANSGKPNALNAAAFVAKGEYLAFMDHDDLMLPNRLESQLAFLEENPKIDACSCHCYYIDDDGRTMGRQVYPQIKTIEECQNVIAKDEIVIAAFTGLTIKKSAFINSGGLITEFWPSDDVEFFNRFIEKHYTLVIMQKVLMKYRAHSNSTSIMNAWNVYVERGNYTNYYIRARRKGEAKMSFNEFKELENKKPWLTKLKIKMYFYSMIYQKEAGFALGSKKIFQFLWKIALSSILNPAFMLATVRKRLSMKVS